MPSSHQPSRRRRAKSSFVSSVGTVVATAVVAYGVYRLTTDWMDSSDRNNSSGDEEDKTQPISNVFSTLWESLSGPKHNNRQGQWKERRRRLGRCRLETLRAMENFLSTIKIGIEDSTNTSSTTKALKKLRTQKAQGDVPDLEKLKEEEKILWESIKVEAVTRLLATSYAHSLVFLVLTVQTHAMGGRLYRRQVAGVHEEEVPDLEALQASHRAVLLKTYDYFFEEGIDRLAELVRKSVSRRLEGWDVSDPASVNFTYEQVRQAFQEILDDVMFGKTRPGSNKRPRNVLRFFLPLNEDENVGRGQQDGLGVEPETQSILDETWDILESPVFEDALADCAQQTFEILDKSGWGKLFQSPTSETPAPTQPLATIIAQVKAASNSVYETGEDSKRMVLEMYNTRNVVLELGDVSFN